MLGASLADLTEGVSTHTLEAAGFVSLAVSTRLIGAAVGLVSFKAAFVDDVSPAAGVDPEVEAAKARVLRVRVGGG